jgi:hypothetical protein
MSLTAFIADDVLLESVTDIIASLLISPPPWLEMVWFSRPICAGGRSN